MHSPSNEKRALAPHTILSPNFHKGILELLLDWELCLLKFYMNKENLGDRIYIEKRQFRNFQFWYLCLTSYFDSSDFFFLLQTPNTQSSVELFSPNNVNYVTPIIKY